MKRMCRINLSVIVLVFINKSFLWCFFLFRNKSPFMFSGFPACLMGCCMQCSTCQVFFFAPTRSAHANNLRYLGWAEAVPVNTGLYDSAKIQLSYMFEYFQHDPSLQHAARYFSKASLCSQFFSACMLCDRSFIQLGKH